MVHYLTFFLKLLFFCSLFDHTLHANRDTSLQGRKNVLEGLDVYCSILYNDKVAHKDQCRCDAFTETSLDGHLNSDFMISLHFLLKRFCVIREQYWDTNTLYSHNFLRPANYINILND